MFDKGEEAESSKNLKPTSPKAYFSAHISINSFDAFILPSSDFSKN
jgi:hypothetical protein